jgi:hypothetical protein
LFLEREWERAGTTLTAAFEQSRATGSRKEEWWEARLLARVCRFTEERAQSAQFLLRALEISRDGGDILFELATRSSFATMAADAGDTGEALPHLERCRQIVGAGEDWLGLLGSVERAEAVVAAAQRDYAAAEAHFEKVIATFQRFCLPWGKPTSFNTGAPDCSQPASGNEPSRSSTPRLKSTARAEPVGVSSNT